MGRWLLKHVGLARPYRFERTLVVLASFVLFIAFVIFVILLARRDDLAWGTPRAWYFVYLAGLIVAAFLSARLSGLAAVLLSLAALEMGLGMGSFALYKFRLIPSETLAPSNVRQTLQFQWHPLLQAVPTQTAADATDVPIRINADHQRGKEHSADAIRGKILVALFGGSTTFDGRQRDGLSWPDRLQHIVGDRYVVVNHGMGGYTTAELVLQTAFYERTRGVTPNCAVYYVGGNDIRNAHVAGLDPGFANFHLPNQVDSNKARRTDNPLSFSPIATFVGRLAALAFDTVRPAAAVGAISAEPDHVLEDIFARNIASISAINRARGIRTIWIGQLLVRSLLISSEPTAWVPFVASKDVYPMVQRLTDILQRQAAALGDVLAEVPEDRFTQAELGDAVHFTEQGALLFASLLAPVVTANCR